MIACPRKMRCEEVRKIGGMASWLGSGGHCPLRSVCALFNYCVLLSIRIKGRKTVQLDIHSNK